MITKQESPSKLTFPPHSIDEYSSTVLFCFVLFFPLRLYTLHGAVLTQGFAISSNYSGLQFMVLDWKWAKKNLATSIIISGKWIIRHFHHVVCLRCCLWLMLKVIWASFCFLCRMRLYKYHPDSSRCLLLYQ